MQNSEISIEADDESKAEIGRVEAFSDGVVAIIVTIMVLELHAPEVPGLGALAHLWPTFLAYVLSYLYVAVYWVNHHRLFSHARMVTNGLLWANMALLFALSLVPFTTAYLGAQHFSGQATRVYLVSLMGPAQIYVFLQASIRRSGQKGPKAQRYHRANARKGIAAMAVYLLGFTLSWLSPWTGIACAALVAVAWCLPSSRLDRLFVACED